MTILENTRLAAAIDLAADDIVFFARKEDGKPVAAVSCNDFFVSGADAEDIEWSEIMDFWRLLHDASDKHRAAMEWIAKKRGVECKNWREK